MSRCFITLEQSCIQAVMVITHFQFFLPYHQLEGTLFDSCFLKLLNLKNANVTLVVLMELVIWK